MEPEVTLVMVPRERHSLTPRTITGLYEHTEGPFELIVVVGDAPRSIVRWLEGAAAGYGFQLVVRSEYLPPNTARNLGARQVRTPLVGFLDNDLVLAPGWLAALRRCIEETDAWVVGPTYMEGDPAGDEVHMAGGYVTFAGEEPRRTFTTDQRHQHRLLSEISDDLQREQVDFAEFHAVLMTTDAYRQVGGFDERLSATREHIDLGLEVAARGGTVWYEPDSRVTYLDPPPLAARDVPYFLRRWSPGRVRASLEHFVDKHGIDPAYVEERLPVYRRRRMQALDPVRRMLRGVAGQENVDRLQVTALQALQRAGLRV